MHRCRVVAVVFALVGLSCGPTEEPPAAVVALPDGARVHPLLAAHSAEFEPRVVEVTAGVHVAIGYGIANSILVEGDDGVVVVDAMASRESAARVRAEFEKITDKPVVALVYTHNHADHVFGGLGFVPDGAVDVYAHATTNFYIDRVVNLLRPAIFRRSERMFGNYLPRGEEGLVNIGVGPYLEVGHGGGTPGLIRANKTFDERLEVTLAGVRFELVHAPGETADQIFVWLPDKKVLLPGDNVYKAFPNLYTIRGTPYRDVLAWVESLDAMRALEPEHLVPSHTGPVSGTAEVADVLTNYRDAIQFVHDQTVRGMNLGMTADELVEFVRLPPHLADHPYLAELYGTVEWSVRSVFTGYLGWFGGDAASLSPAPPSERARGFVELAGGQQQLLEAVRDAVESGRFRWAAELAGELVRAAPELAEARALKAVALRELGRRSVSPNGRHYYLTQALELEGEVTIEPQRPTEANLELVRSIPIGNFMRAMPAALDAEAAHDVDRVLGFRFTDVDEAFAVHIRRGVAEIREGWPDDPDAGLTTTTRTWIDIVTKQRSLPAAVATGDVSVEGGVLGIPGIVTTLTLFKPV